MEWRITENSHGGFDAEYGGEIKSGEVLSPTGIGYIMPAFIVQESTHFDTRQQAERYVRKRTKGNKRN